MSQVSAILRRGWHKRSDIVAMPPIPTHLAAVDDGFQPSGSETQD